MTEDEEENDKGISGVQYENPNKRRAIWTMYHNVYYEVGVSAEERVKAGAKRRRIEVL